MVWVSTADASARLTEAHHRYPSLCTPYMSRTPPLRLLDCLPGGAAALEKVLVLAEALVGGCAEGEENTVLCHTPPRPKKSPKRLVVRWDGSWYEILQSVACDLAGMIGRSERITNGIGPGTSLDGR